MEMRYLKRRNPQRIFLPCSHPLLLPAAGWEKIRNESKSQPPVVFERKECPPFWKGKKGSSARAVMREVYHFATDAVFQLEAISNFILLEELPKVENDLLPSD